MFISKCELLNFNKNETLFVLALALFSGNTHCTG